MPKPTTLKLLEKTDNAKIYETDSFKDGIYFLEKHKKRLKKLLALFDLDNTILSYRHTLGTDQWYDFDYNEFISQGKTPQEAKDNTLQSYLNIIKKIHSDDVYVVEEDTPALIRNIQSSEIDTLILTSRGSYLLENTFQQLQKFELDFNQGRFKNKEKALSQSKEGLFTHGMILTGGAHKGECLMSCLTEEQTLPEVIVMWDDKLSNLERVRDAIKRYNDQKAQDALAEKISFTPIQFIGIRYSKLDHLVKAINPDIVALQARYFERILSDEHAELILKAQIKKERHYYVDIDYQPAQDSVTLSVCKSSIYRLLINIEPNIKHYQQLCDTPKKFFDKEKLVWQFKLTLNQFETLFHKLSQHGLIEPSQFDILSIVFNKTQAAHTPLFDNIATTTHGNISMVALKAKEGVTRKEGAPLFH